MSIGRTIRRILFCLIFLIGGVTPPAWPLTFAAQTKEIHIDADWRITGNYHYEFRIMDSDDTRQIKQLIRQLKKRTDSAEILSMEIQLPDGRRCFRDTDITGPLPTGTSVVLAFRMFDAFPGFEGLFTDYMNIDQAVPLQKTAYRIMFPQKTNFTCRVRNGDEMHHNRLYADSFFWSGDNIRHLDIMVSTATSWEQIRERYDSLFQQQMGNGVAGTDLPEPFRNIEQNSTPADKVHAVLNFLKTGIDYRGRSNTGGRLFPDAPETVLSRGWGDCKDIALLGTAMLQAMDIDAFVALSGKPRLFGIGEVMYDPFIFDHALIGIPGEKGPAYYDAFIADTDGRVILSDQHIYMHLKVSSNAGH
jgi:hypothetical protein